jgi:hypothetical protein
VAPLCSPLPGESLPARLRRYAKQMAWWEFNAPILDAMEEAADALDRSYDEKQKAAQLVVCSQCGHQVYSTVKAEA